MTACDYCHVKSARKNGRFCCDQHRSAWHRENKYPGVVKGLRALKRGWSVTVFYPNQPVGINIGTKIMLETPDSARTDASQTAGQTCPIP